MFYFFERFYFWFSKGVSIVNWLAYSFIWLAEQEYLFLNFKCVLKFSSVCIIRIFFINVASVFETQYDIIDPEACVRD